MNIGIDATCWWNNRGFGRFTRELLSALFQLETEHSFFLFVDQPLEDLAAFPHVKILSVGTTRPTTKAAIADSSRSPFDMYRMYRKVASIPLDIFYFPAVYSWFPVPRELPTMVTLHDAIAEHYPQLIFSSWKSRFFWNLKIKLAIWNSQRVLTVSNAAKNEIVEFIGVAPERIDIASEAPNALFRRTTDAHAIEEARLRAKLPQDAPIIVYVGGLAPHKNLHGLLDGLEKAFGTGRISDIHLALVGDFEGAGFLSNYDSLNARVQESPLLSGKVHFSGYVSDEDLVALYSSALALAMPSYSEGFGLPAVEAMACGAPVLCSDSGSLPEVVGDAGIYFDPSDTDSIATAILKMVEDVSVREQLSVNALVRAQGFTWDRAARLALAHLEGLHRG